MSAEVPPLTGPDLLEGVAPTTLADGGMVVGHAFGEPVLLVRRGGDFHAVGATCTHYGGPLGEGLVVGDTVRCPWHHACFSLRTGEALRAPALKPVPCYAVARREGRVVVTGKIDPSDGAVPVPAASPLSSEARQRRVVVIGGGAAGSAAVEMLRRSGHEGAVTLIGADPSVPYDRPNLSKDYLAGTAPEEWIPLRGREFYDTHQITLALGVAATAIDPRARTVTTADGTRHPFDRLLIATGADPLRLSVPGAELSHVHTLRTLADSRAIAERAGKAKRAVVVGASFIGLEVAAALRARGVEVHVVAPDGPPLGRVMGAGVGTFVRSLHEARGVVFHLGDSVASIEREAVTLARGGRLAADLVIVGVGVRPNTALAEHAGLAVDREVVVDRYLQTSQPGIYAAGDIVRWPDPHTGEALHTEHWVVAQRQGQTAARNMLGLREPFNAVPFFWSQHYDVQISYVGHAAHWDTAEIVGALDSRDATVSLRAAGRTVAVITVGRDIESLRAEAEFEHR